jgi:NTP pyrophosphatase (non-canonical NTP hydrolase)
MHLRGDHRVVIRVRRTCSFSWDFSEGHEARGYGERHVWEAFVQISEFQQLMDDIYGARDRERGLSATVAWLAEEVGELAQAVRKGDDARREHELGDVLAWLASLANQLGLSLDDAGARYAHGCPRCRRTPCACE